jgi:hypothetical protein
MGTSIEEGRDDGGESTHEHRIAQRHEGVLRDINESHA